MNKEYIQAGESFIVSTDSGLKKVQRLDNMTEILETENNIEEIENMKKKNDEQELFDFDNILAYLDGKFLKKFVSIAIPITIITGVTTFILSNVSLAILFSLMVLAGSTFAASFVSTLNLHKHNKIMGKISNSANKLLDAELEKQKQKDKILHIESKVLPRNDLGILDETIKINRTKQMEDLKRKLQLIASYELIKNDLIKFSDDYLLLVTALENAGYSENDIKFIYELMKQDIEENEKSKTLKLEKK